MCYFLKNLTKPAINSFKNAHYTKTRHINMIQK